MAQTNLNIRMDEDLKAEFDTLCDELGLTMTTAINVFVKTFVRKQGMPFDVAVDPFYSEQNMKRLSAVIEDIKAGRNMTVHELIEVDDD